MSKMIPFALVLLAVTAAGYDEEASNVPRIFTSSYGRCYAKAVPDSLYGESGHTSVYWVRAGKDSLLADYRWYSQQVYLECNVATGKGRMGLSVVRMGPWARGQRATGSDLALAFYRNSRLLKRYSTLDIATRPDKVQASMSHYVVLDSVMGYRSIGGGQFGFDVRTVDGRRIAFDAATGERQ